MEKFVDKFNIFDLFTMLIPGIINTTLFVVSLYPIYGKTWSSWGNEKIALFFILSYFCGVIFQEFGTIMDEKFFNKIIYGGNPREIYLIKNKYKKIYKEKLFFNNMLYIKKYFRRALSIANNMYANEEEFNSMVFDYCMNIAEKNKWTTKSEKMTVISEMSRSLFWGCFLTILLNKWLITFCHCSDIYLWVEIPFLFFAAMIFLNRQIRYEKYSMEELLRIIYLHINEENLKKGV